MNRCRLCIKRAAPGRLGAAEAGSGARRRLGAARMRRGTYAEPPRHAGAVQGGQGRTSCHPATEQQLRRILYVQRHRLTRMIQINHYTLYHQSRMVQWLRTTTFAMLSLVRDPPGTVTIPISKCAIDFFAAPRAPARPGGATFLRPAPPAPLRPCPPWRCRTVTACTPVGPPRGCGHSRAATWLRRHRDGGA